MRTNGESQAESDSLEPAMETAVFGREVEIFLNEHPVATYIVNRAKADLDEAHAALVTAQATDFHLIAGLQLKARVAQHVTQWLREAIQAGRAAEVTLKQERDEYGR